MSGLWKPFRGSFRMSQPFGPVPPIPGLPGGGEPPGYLVRTSDGKPWIVNPDTTFAGGAGATRHPNVHYGVDYALPRGTKLYAPAAVRVIDRTFDPISGKLLTLKILGRATWILMAHLDDFELPQGATADAGELVGISGATGRVTGAHLHFEVRHGADWPRSRFNPRRLMVGADHADVDWIVARP